MKHRFDRLLQLYKDQIATREEQLELFELIQSGAYDSDLLEDISNTLLDAGPGLLYTTDPIKDDILRRVISVNIDDRDPRSIDEAGIATRNLGEGGSWLAIAASLVLAATSSLWVFHNQQQHYADEKHYSGKGVFILPDGTRVTLGDDTSALSYFTEGNNRVVKVLGEASFELEWDPHHPFFVQTGDVRTRVIGSSFNVRAYAVQTDIPLKPLLDLPDDPSIPNINNPQTIL